MAEFRNGVMQAMYYDNSVKSSIKKGKGRKKRKREGC